MLIVDGNTIDPPVTVWQETFTNLKVGQAYSFGFIEASLYPVSPAQLSVYANGKIIDQHYVDDVGFFSPRSTSWISLSETSVTISIVDTNTTFVGNDFAIDDIYFQPVPEPASYGLMASGLLMILAAVRGRQNHGDRCGMRA
jgi:hypothetical protein